MLGETLYIDGCHYRYVTFACSLKLQLIRYHSCCASVRCNQIKGGSIFLVTARMLKRLAPVSDRPLSWALLIGNQHIPPLSCGLSDPELATPEKKNKAKKKPYGGLPSPSFIKMRLAGMDMNCISSWNSTQLLYSL